MEIKMSVMEIKSILSRDFPQVADDFEIIDLSKGAATLALIAKEQHLRPGGTISGPAMFALADLAAYVAILASLGPVMLAVTTSCAIDFMRKPAPGQLLCRMELLKLGRVLAVTEGRLFIEGQFDKPVARASLTYSIPPSS